MTSHVLPDSLLMQGVLAVLVLAILLAFYRLARGPSVPDRVVAVDLIGVLTAGIAAVYAIATGRTAFLDAAIVLALVSFLGTVAFAKFIEKRALGARRR